MYLNGNVVGLEMVVSQLPRLQLLDCGKVIVDNWNGMNQASTDANDHVDHDDEHDVRHRKSGVCVLQLYHLELEKLSLWGCSGLQVKGNYLTWKHRCFLGVLHVGNRMI